MTFITRHQAGILTTVLLALSMTGIIYFRNYLFLSVVRHWILYLIMMAIIMISLPPYFLLLQAKNLPLTPTRPISKLTLSKQTPTFASSKPKARPFLSFQRNKRLPLPPLSRIFNQQLPLRKEAPPPVWSSLVPPIPQLHPVKPRPPPSSKSYRIPSQPGEMQQRALQDELEDISRRLNSLQFTEPLYPKNKSAPKYHSSIQNLREQSIERELQGLALPLRKKRKSMQDLPASLEKQKWDEKLVAVEKKLRAAEELPRTAPATKINLPQLRRLRNIIALQKELEKELEGVAKKTKRSKKKHSPRSPSTTTFASTELTQELQHLEEKIRRNR